ncbi:DUF349 domain-containing protein [Scardovia wiggsiae]|mgnify:CR=1 FL=1|uniref:DUF349 domain-containing protein n=1 Tax=Scardovia wiggsiae TaxID=230143 RepID=UPI00360B93EA
MTDESVTTTSSDVASEKAEASQAPKPFIPSPKAFAGRTQKSSTVNTYNAADLENASSFGRVAEDGTVYVKDGDDEREVGQLPKESAEGALHFFARRYLDLKAKIDRFGQRLDAGSIRSREIDNTLSQLDEDTESPDVVGDIPALRDQLESLKARSVAVKEKLAQKRKAAVAQAAEEREHIVAEAEELVKGLNDSVNWKQTGDKLQELFSRWQEHQKNSIHIERSQADALWKRFSAARSSFNSARRSWMQQRDTVRAAAKEQKEKIIARAEELKNSTDWAGTSRQFNNLMDQWKAAGRVGRRSEDDALWKRFREAADTFFDARQADRNKTNEDEAENLKKKEELLVKAQALVPVNTAEQAKQARQALARIQDDWDSIGHVPRTDVHRIESALDDVEKQIKAAEDAQWTQSDPETDARKSDFEVQLNTQLAELDRKIAAEADPAKKKDLESEKAAKEAWLKAIS